MMTTQMSTMDDPERNPTMANQRVRWGLLSTARINERLIGPLRETDRSELLVVASRDREKAEKYADHWEIPRFHGSYEELLSDPEIDAVYISLPNGLHAEWTVKCADAGKHVLCEKPLALTIEEVDQIGNAAERNGVVVQEAAMMRYHPQTEYVQQLVEEGAIGRIRLLRGIFAYVLDNPHDVRMDPAQGGGCLWDLGSYCIRFMRTVMQQEPVEVVASEIKNTQGVDSSFAGQMRFSSGTHAQFFCSLQTFAHVEADLFGTDGRMQLTSPWVNHLDRDAHVHLIRHDGSSRKGNWDDGMLNQSVDSKTYTKINAYADEVRSMVTSILDGADPVLPLSDSRQNTIAVLALFESAKKGRAVKIESH